MAKVIKEEEIRSHIDPSGVADFVISGGGIVGLVLALAMKKHLGITPEIYEKANAFVDDVGAALGMYPNGMRVLRDIDPKLLSDIKSQGYPYLYRRWERHDGTGKKPLLKKCVYGTKIAFNSSQSLLSLFFCF